MNALVNKTAKENIVILKQTLSATLSIHLSLSTFVSPHTYRYVPFTLCTFSLSLFICSLPLSLPTYLHLYLDICLFIHLCF